MRVNFPYRGLRDPFEYDDAAMLLSTLLIKHNDSIEDIIKSNFAASLLSENNFSKFLSGFSFFKDPSYATLLLLANMKMMGVDIFETIISHLSLLNKDHIFYERIVIHIVSYLIEDQYNNIINVRFKENSKIVNKDIKEAIIFAKKNFGHLGISFNLERQFLKFLVKHDEQDKLKTIFRSTNNKIKKRDFIEKSLLQCDNTASKRKTSQRPKQNPPLLPKKSDRPLKVEKNKTKKVDPNKPSLKIHHRVTDKENHQNEKISSPVKTIDNDKKQKRIDELEHQNTTLRFKAKEKNKHITTQNSTIVELKNNSKQQEMTLQSQKETISELENKIFSLENELKERKKIKKEHDLSSKINSLREQVEKLKLREQELEEQNKLVNQQSFKNQIINRNLTEQFINVSEKLFFAKEYFEKQN